MRQVYGSWDSMTVAIGIVVGISILAGGVIAETAHAGTITIGATPDVVDQVEIVAQAFEATNPNDRVQIAVATEDQWKGNAKRAPVQVIVSDNPAFFDWLEAREVAKRVSDGPAVHMPLAVVGVASSGAEIGSMHNLDSLLHRPETKVAIANPSKTDCGRRAQALLKSLGVGSFDQIVSVKSNTQVIEFVRSGKTHLGIVFSPDAAGVNGVAIYAVSVPQAGSPVHNFAVKRGQEEHPVAKRFLGFAKSSTAQRALQIRGYEVLQAQGEERPMDVAAWMATASQ